MTDEDARLTDFLGGEEAADAEADAGCDDRGGTDAPDGRDGAAVPDDRDGTAASDGRDGAVVEDDAPSTSATTDPGDVPSARTTADWTPGGAVCGGCGAVVERRWRDGDRFVCADCKEW